MTIIITQPGDYVTRNGLRVTIREIRVTSTFSAKGAVWREFRGKFKPRGYNIWKPDGSYRAIGEHALDIVGPYIGTSDKIELADPRTVLVTS